MNFKLNGLDILCECLPLMGWTRSDSNLADVKSRSGHQSGCLLMNQSPVCWIVFLALPLKWQSLRIECCSLFSYQRCKLGSPRCFRFHRCSWSPWENAQKTSLLCGTERKESWLRKILKRKLTKREAEIHSRQVTSPSWDTYTHHSLAHSVLLLNYKIKLSCL